MDIIAPESLAIGRKTRDAVLDSGGDPEDAFDAGAIVVATITVAQHTDVKDLEIKALQDELAEIRHKIINGFQGGCYCCEIVAIENQKLAALIARLEGGE